MKTFDLCKYLAKDMKKNQGFTLIEMLVVMTVIGVVVGISAYNNSRVLKRSKDAALKVELGLLREAVYRFSLDNSGNFPESLENLKEDELGKVPAKWAGSNGKGLYHFDAETGNIFLFDENGEGLSQAVDSAGIKYGDY
ncbi:MAG: hypothetical protein Kow0029_24240 [Candidatus Rifleibacteriota bacterium]